MPHGSHVVPGRAGRGTRAVRRGARLVPMRPGLRTRLLVLLVCALACTTAPATAAPSDPVPGPVPGQRAGAGADARTAVGDRRPPFTLPADGEVVRLFLAPAVRWGAGHRGVDVTVTDGVVRAPADGTVTWAGHVVDRGVLTITHAGGLRTSLEPVAALHPVGTTVGRGDPVALLEDRRHGRCTEACVHWGVRDGDVYVDPLRLLAPVTVRLLPWT